MRPSNHDYLIASAKETLSSLQSAMELSVSDMRSWLDHSSVTLADYKTQYEIASTAEDAIWNIEQALVLLERVQVLSVRVKANAKPESKYWVFDEHNNMTQVTEAQAAQAQGLTVEEMRAQDQALADEWETEAKHKRLLDAQEYEADMSSSFEPEDDTDED